MKLILTLLFALCLSAIGAKAQVIPIYFYGDSIVTNKARATSYAIYGKLSTEDLWVFKRYDLYDNLLQTGSYKDEKLSIPHGKFSFYMDIDEFNEIYVTNFRLKGATRFLNQQGTFENGIENGKWLLFYPSGTILNSQSYLNGKLHGEFVTYDKNGNVEIKGNYVDGLLDGKWIFEGGQQEVVYEMGVLKTSENIKINKKIKNKTNLNGLRILNKVGGKQRGAAKNVEAPQPNRSFEKYMTVGNYNVYVRTKFNYPPDTKFKLIQGNFIDGLEEGEWTWFYPDGKPKTIVNFSKGKPHGDFVSYDLEGKPHTKGTYQEGVRNGDWLVAGRKEIYKNGIGKFGRLPMVTSIHIDFMEL